MSADVSTFSLYHPILHLIDFCSSRIVRNGLRYVNYVVRGCLGAFLDRLDITGFEARLRDQCRRQCSSRTLCNHG